MCSQKENALHWATTTEEYKYCTVYKSFKKCLGLDGFNSSCDYHSPPVSILGFCELSQGLN